MTVASVGKPSPRRLSWLVSRYSNVRKSDGGWCLGHAELAPHVNGRTAIRRRRPFWEGARQPHLPVSFAEAFSRPCWKFMIQNATPFPSSWTRVVVKLRQGGRIPRRPIRHRHCRGRVLFQKRSANHAGLHDSRRDPIPSKVADLPHSSSLRCVTACPAVSARWRSPKNQNCARFYCPGLQ